MCRGVRRERQKEGVEKIEMETERDEERYKQKQTQGVCALGVLGSVRLGIIL